MNKLKWKLLHNVKNWQFHGYNLISDLRCASIFFINLFSFANNLFLNFCWRCDALLFLIVLKSSSTFDRHFFFYLILKVFHAHARDLLSRLYGATNTLKCQ